MIFSKDFLSLVICLDANAKSGTFPGRIARRMQKGMAWVIWAREQKIVRVTTSGQRWESKGRFGRLGDGDSCKGWQAGGGAADVDE